MFDRIFKARRGLRAALPALLVIAACSEDPAEPNINQAFVGNWVASSFVYDGTELVTPTSSFNVSFGFFADGSYQMIVGGDTNMILCQFATSCVDSGDYSFTGTVITLDPGSVDEFGLQWSVSANTLSVSGTLDGLSFSAVFDRI